MRELERMQQQTLAVQSQLSQNMRINDSFSRGGGGGESGAGGYSAAGGSSQPVMSSGGASYNSMSSSYNSGSGQSGYVDQSA